MDTAEHVSDFLLTVQDMADLLCLSTREVWRREAAGQIPAAIRLGRKTVRWKGSEVEAYMQQLGRERAGKTPPTNGSAS
jgi:predicted DNA-binding transcriptional regulator AlpA